LKQFPAFRTRFFYFSKKKNKKELKQMRQSGLGICTILRACLTKIKM